jgi:hypothetical protein
MSPEQNLQAPERTIKHGQEIVGSSDAAHPEMVSGRHALCHKLTLSVKVHTVQSPSHEKNCWGIHGTLIKGEMQLKEVHSKEMLTLTKHALVLELVMWHFI